MNLRYTGVNHLAMVTNDMDATIYSFDPNHIPIEFSAPVGGVDLRASPHMADHHPTAAAREGSDQVAGRWPRVENPTAPTERQVFPGESIVFRKAGDLDSNKSQE
jgi:hypothetical protein